MVRWIVCLALLCACGPVSHDGEIECPEPEPIECPAPEKEIPQWCWDYLSREDDDRELENRSYGEWRDESWDE